MKTEILIVDDREENLISLKKLLEPLDVVVNTALSGNEALQKLVGSDFAMVLIDVQMPEMDGFETVQIMRQDKTLETTPVIFLSAIYREDVHLIKGIESGAVDFLVKPIIPEVLLGKVQIFLDLFENRKKLEWELLVNRTVSDLAKELIEPELSIKDMADKVHKASLLLSGSEQGFVSEIDQETGDNICHTLSAMMSESEPSVAFPKGEDGLFPGMWGHVLNSGKTLLVDNYELSEFKKGLPDGHVPIRNFLSAPVIYGGEVLGQIAMANSKEGYGEEHRESLEKVADLYAIAINRKREEQHKLEMEEEMLQAEKMQVIGQLAGGMAHNFNNILNGILNAAQLLKSRVAQEDEGNRKYTDIIISSSIRAAGITDKLLQYARKMKTEQKIFSMEKVVEDSIIILKSTIDSKIDVTFQCPEGLRKIQGEITSIQNVLLNLGLNASHAISDKGSIDFTVENMTLKEEFCRSRNLDLVPGEYLQIRVSDTGCGITKENLQHIFEPFFTTRVQGTGLGLSVSYRTIADHKGTILVDSKEGAGTTFTLYLPAVDEEEDMEQEKGELQQGYGLILFVDDEEINRVTGQDLLESLGYDVLVAGNGRSALAIFEVKHREIDLVITDMQMPEMDGLETISRIRDISEECKVILISGFSENIHKGKIEEQSVSGFIQKPYDLIDFSKTVSNVLNQS